MCEWWKSRSEVGRSSHRSAESAFGERGSKIIIRLRCLTVRSVLSCALEELSERMDVWRE